MRRWSELPPLELELELAKLGITVRDLVRDAHYVPELQPMYGKLSSAEARQKVALEWFGDQRHPQPERREPPVGVIGVVSHDWGRLPLLDGDERPAAPAPTRKKRGRRKGKVSIYEANLAATIYAEDRAEYDARDDGGAYAVHKLYIEDREPGLTLLSRPMIGYLLDAIRAGWVPWDARQKRLRISDEFRTGRSTFVIPRRESPS